MEQPQLRERLAGEDERDTTHAPVRPAFGEIPWLLLLAAVGVLAALLDVPVVLRTLLGLPLILFLPGYALVSALFPSREGLDDIERVALGFGLSLALIPLIALGIEYSPWRLTLGPILAGLLAATVVFSAVAVLRRTRLPEASRYVPGKPRLAMPRPRTWKRRSRFAAGIIVVGVLLLAGAGGIIVSERLQGEPMTELALYNADGKPEHYPRQMSPDQPATLIVEVTNREGKAESYHLRITAGDTEIGSVDRISVADGATVRQPVTLRDLPASEDSIPIAFDLFRDDQPTASTPYRSLRLFVPTGAQPVTP